MLVQGSNVSISMHTKFDQKGSSTLISYAYNLLPSRFYDVKTRILCVSFIKFQMNWKIYNRVRDKSVDFIPSWQAYTKIYDVCKHVYENID